MTLGRVPFSVASTLLRRGALANRSLGSVRSKWLSGKEAAGPNVPVGGRMGAPENPELHTYDGHYSGSPDKGDKLLPDYTYRTPTAGDTYIDRTVTKGHWYMPYLHEFTDEELGIPPDDAPDPAYWGNHGKPYGTYR